MRKVVLVSLTLVLVGALMGSGAQAAQKKVVRKASGTYATPAPNAFGLGGGFCNQQDGIGCVTFKVKRTERFARFSVVDQSGQTIFATWGQDYDGDSVDDSDHQFCGKTGLVRIRPGIPVDVFIWGAAGFDPRCDAPATSGTVKAVFSNLR